MKPTTKRFASILISILFLIFSVLIYGNWVLPLYREINIQRAIIAEKESQYGNFKTLSASYKNWDDKYKNSGNFTAGLNETMPLDRQIPAEINQLTTLVDIANGLISPGSLGNLKLTSINVKEDALTPEKTVSIVKNKGVLKFDIGLSGTYEAFKQYMSLLEQNSRLISVNSVNIRSDEKNINALSFDLSLETYYQLR